MTRRGAQGGEGPGFALEPLPQLGISADVFGQDLDGDRAVEARVAGCVDFAHAPCTDGGLDFIGAEAGAGGEGHTLWIIRAGRQSGRDYS